MKEGSTNLLRTNAKTKVSLTWRDPPCSTSAAAILLFYFHGVTLIPLTPAGLILSLFSFS